jgi:hypothetical protein
VDSEFIEEDCDGMIGVAGLDDTAGPGSVPNGDDDGNSIVHQTTLTAVSGTGSRLKRASKDVSIENTTKNARQQLMQGQARTSHNPSQRLMSNWKQTEET